MNIMTVVLGSLAVLFGLYTLIARFKTPEKFKKLQAMQKTFGQGVGTGIHVFAYSIIPIAFGLFIIRGGLLGLSFLQIYSR